jgi:hypothetical protein
MLGPFSRCLVLSAVLAVAMPAMAEGPSRELADRTLALLASGDAAALAAIHHYPPTYTSEELETDTRAVSKGLAFLLNRFGAPRAPKLATTSTTFFSIGTTGGTNEYWASATPTQSDRYVYHVDFPKLGKGFVKVDVVAFSWERIVRIKGIDFGLPQTPRSKQIMLSAMRDLLVEMSVPIPDDFDRLAEQALQPITAPPAKLDE